MDILQIIKDKAKLLPADEKSTGVQAVITHIETAEKYLARADAESDENLFTDVIYRTNYAFEGILKEAYRIIAERDPEKRTPNEIELYLAENNIFRSRVMDLFGNYRNQWRNPSTHDYKLFFTEQEAFLAVVTVSAFTNILLDQIIETINFKLGKIKAEQNVNAIKKAIQNYNSLPLLYKTKDLFIEFGKDLIKHTQDISTMHEYQIIGLLSGFIKAIEPSFLLIQEPVIAKDLRPDLNNFSW